MPEIYAKAPIIEAIVSFVVSLPDDATVQTLERLKDRLASSFPSQSDIYNAELAIQDRAASKNTLIGFRLSSQDKRTVLQLTTEGFTISQLAPYESWSPFRDEARKWWNEYRIETKATGIGRIAVRYINRLDIPSSQKVNAYLLLYPSIPQYRHRELAGSFLQVQIPQPDIDSVLVLNQAQIEPPDPTTTSFILDLDLFRIGAWDAQDDGSAWDALELLRERKNEIFEASITQKAREMMR